MQMCFRPCGGAVWSGWRAGRLAVSVALAVLVVSGCVFVAPPDPLVADAGVNKILTLGTSTTISGAAFGGEAPYRFQWLQTDGPTLTIVPANADTATISVSAVQTGTATLRLTVTDAAGRVADDTMSVVIRAPESNLAVSAAASPSDVVLPAGTTLSATVSGGTPGYAYNWLQTGGPAALIENANAQNTEVTFLTPGSYTFTVTVTDAAGASVTSDAVTVTVTGTIPIEFTLNTDNLAGTAGDDTFSAPLLGVTQDNTLQTGDQADGLDGTDTLNAFLNGDSAAPVLTSIEVLNITSIGGPNTLDAANVTGATSINVTNSNQNLTIANLASLVELGILSSTGTVTVNYAAPPLAGGADEGTLRLNGANGSLVITSAGVSGLETLNVQTSGATSTLAVLSVAGLSRINVSGNQALTVTTALDPGVTVVDASEQTAGVGVIFGAAAATFIGGSGDDAVTATGGSDDLTPGGGADTVATGAGADVIRYDALTDGGAPGAGSTAGADSLTDFTAGAGGDVISLRAAAFQGTATGIVLQTGANSADGSSAGGAVDPADGTLLAVYVAETQLTDYGSLQTLLDTLAGVYGAANNTALVVADVASLGQLVVFDPNLDSAGDEVVLAVFTTPVTLTDLAAENFDVH